MINVTQQSRVSRRRGRVSWTAVVEVMIKRLSRQARELTFNHRHNTSEPPGESVVIDDGIVDNDGIGGGGGHFDLFFLKN